LDAWLRQEIADGLPIAYAFRSWTDADEVDPAALATETGGRLAGTAGFWAIHSWLMTRDGKWSKSDLEKELVRFGVDVAAFDAASRLPDTADAASADRREFEAMGIPALPLLLVDNRWVPRWRSGDEPVLRRIIEHALAAAP
jgi:hypothetical protein